jgi:DMSO/TMAO reductase YedYZ molybdopterin-dependent catalytic subunit
MTAKLWGDRGRKRAEKLGLDPDRLPPGQSPTLKFPVLTVGPEPEIDASTWTFEVNGLVERPFRLDHDELLALPQVTQTSDIHCVTRWSKLGTSWTGVRVRDLLGRAGVRDGATHAMVHAHGGYTTNIDLPALLDDDVLLAHAFDGAPLEHEHGGPVRLLVPSRYFWKSAKWVSAIELMDRDRPGFWERNGYHDHGDPWRQERRG